MRVSTPFRAYRSALAFSAAAACVALGSAAPSTAQTAPPAASVSALRIKDPAEASDYAAAMIITDPAEQGAALEAFVARYPASRVRAEALENAMAAWLVARDLDKVEALSVRVIAGEPSNARALAMAVFVKRSRAGAAQPAQASALAEQAGALAEKGLDAMKRWRPRQSATDADAASVRNEMLAEFNGALGYRALMRKDYAGAKPFYLAAVKADPTSLDDVYQLSVCMLQATPIDPIGFWWAARAETLAAGSENQTAKSAIEAQIKPRYVRYHGGEEGWDTLVTQAGTGLVPPDGFAVTTAPSAASVAVQAVHDSPISALSISDWEFILAQQDASPANKAAAEKVWAYIVAFQTRGVRFRFPAKVVAISLASLDVAVSDDSLQTGHADLHVKLAEPLASPPTVGAMINVTGIVTSYTPRPFAFTMEQAEIAGP